MNIFEFADYKKFVRNWIENQPKRGHGIYAKIADSIGISSVLVSQIFKGEKNLSLEHAYLLTEFLGLTSDEKDYFLLLVNFEKAGSHKLREHFKKQIKTTQKLKTENLKEIVNQDMVLSEADKAVFYSNWLYSAIRLQTSVKGYQSLEALSQKFQIPREQVSSLLEFLVEKGLCIRTDKGFEMGPRRTHLEGDSPYVKSRQISWRIKSFEKMDVKNSSQLFYTAPMSISENDYKALRKAISDLIVQMTTSLVTEEPEKLACLNIDLFEI